MGFKPRALAWLLLLFTCQALATDVPISGLPALTNADAVQADMLPIVDTVNHATKSITLGQLDLRWLLQSMVTGSGNTVLANSPTLVTPALGTPSALVLTNATGLPLTSGVTGVLPVANGGTNATSAGAARTSLGAAASGANSDITSLTGLTSALPASEGGTGVTSVTTTPTASAFAGWDASSNLSANNFLAGYATTVTAAATTTLTAASAMQQYFTGSSGQTVLMPVVSTLPLGARYVIVNNNSSTGNVLVESSGANILESIAPQSYAAFTSVATTGTGANVWSVQYSSNSATGSVTSVAATVPAFMSVAGSPITSSGTLALSYSGTALPIANGGTGATAATGSGNVVLATSPTLVTPALGIPASGVATNLTGLPLTSGVTGTLATGNGGTGSTSASTGSGGVVLATSPTLVTPVLGTPTSATLTNATGLPLTSGVTGVLPGANGGTGVNNTSGTLTFGTNLITLNTVSGTSTVTLPTSGTMVSTNGVQTLSSKTLTAPVMSSYQDLTEITTPTAPSAGIVRLYSKSGDALYYQTPGGVESQVGSGSGSKNYLSAGASSAAIWTASGVGVTATTDTTTSDLPEPTVGTALKVLGVSGSTAFAYADFLLDPSDYNKLLSVQFNQKPSSGYVNSNLQVSVWSCTVAWASGACSGTSVRLPLSTDTSAISALPNLTGSYRTTFGSTNATAPNIQVQLGLNASSTAYMAFSSITVGPGVVTQGAAKSGMGNQYTATVFGQSSSPSIGTGSALASYERSGDTMIINGVIHVVSGSAGSGEYTFPLPPGFSINYAAYGSNSAGNIAVGDNNFTSGFTGTGTTYILNGGTGYTNYLRFAVGANVYNSSNYTFATNQNFSFNARVSVNEWAGSGTVNVAQNDVQYAWNSTATATSDTTGTNNGYGPGGVLFQSFAPTGINGITKRVTFQYPVPAGTKPYLEVDGGSSGSEWNLIADRLGSYGANSAGTSAWGYRIFSVSGSSTQYDVVFYPTFDQVTTDTWSAIPSWHWRLTSANPGVAIGFSSYIPGQSSGLVPAAGLPGLTSGTTVPAGNVGERMIANPSSAVGVTTTGNYITITSLPLTAGIWLVTGSCFLDTGTTTATAALCGISSTTNNLDATTLNNFGFTTGSVPSSATVSYVAGAGRYFNISSSQTVYLVGRLNYTVLGGDTWDVLSAIQAVRVQ